MGDLSASFSRIEFACQCGCGFDRVSPALVLCLQGLRDALGMPVRILSGCRCAAHNAAEGGAKASEHMAGRAADVRVEGIAPREIYDAARPLGFRGFGIDEQRNFVHLDVRPLPGALIARWTYRDGREAPWTEAA